MSTSSSIRNVKLLSIFNFLLDFRLYGPVLLIYFADVSGSYALATSVLSVTMISSAVLEVPTGVLSDRWGRRRVLICGALMSFCAVVVYAIAVNYALLVVGGLLEGLARALYSGNNQALLYDTLAEEGRQSEYHHHAGRVGSMFQLALAISALLGGLVASWSLRGAVALSIFPQLLCVVAAWRIVEPTAHHRIQANGFAHVLFAFRTMRANRRLRRIVVAGALQYGAGETAFQMQPAFVNTLWPTWALGVARTANNGLAFLSFRASGRVLARFGASRTLFWGQVWANTANLVAVVKPTVVSPAVIASESLTYGTSTVAHETLLQREFTDAERATMGSLGTLLGSAIMAALMVAAGLIADRYGLRVALLVTQAVGVAALPLFWAVHRDEVGNRPTAT